MNASELLDLLRSLEQSDRLRLPGAMLESLQSSTAKAFSTTSRSRSNRTSSSTTTATAPVETTLPEHSMQPASAWWHTQTLAVPSYFDGDSESLATAIVLPQHSASSEHERALFLYPWQAEGICLAPADALTFLNSLPWDR